MHWDADLPGFGIRAYPQGRRVWIVQYRNTAGATRRVTLGDLRTVKLDAARRKAEELLSRARLGEDPQAERQAARRAVRVRPLVDDYLSYARKRLTQRSYGEVERHLMKACVSLHHIPASSIDRAEVVRLLDKIASTSGPIAANRVRASLSAFWTWALKAGRLEGENPVAHTPRPTPERSRDRVLSDDELALIWRCTEGGGEYDRIVRLLMLSAARREEVGAMPWGEVELAEGGASLVWTLAADRSKNGLPHELRLGALASKQLPPARANKALVFGASPRGFQGWSKCKERLDGRMLRTLRADFTKTRGREPTDGEVTLRPWRLHDLRRTFATWANEHGHEPHIVEAVLNHVSGQARRGVAGVYNRATYRTQKEALLSAWEAHLLAVSGLGTKTARAA
ncbi:MAG TPA: integrase family protein [Caulobacteraceae bacterium]|nr:integrase family protein [Caulobacteraceae bacterium]